MTLAVYGYAFGPVLPLAGLDEPVARMLAIGYGGLNGGDYHA